VDLDFIDKGTGTNLPLTGDVTDALGQYSVDVPVGVYIVRYDPPAGQPWAAREEKTIRVDADLARPDVQLVDGWEVSGILLDHAGAPVADADLDFVDLATGGKIYVVRDNTDAAGAFAVLVPCGTYDIVFEAPAGHPDASKRLEGVDVPCVPTSVGTVQLDLGIALQGSVRERVSGAPVADADIDVVDEGTGLSLPLADDSTSAAGSYLVLVPAGTYTVTVEPPRTQPGSPGRAEGFVAAPPGPAVADFDLEVGVILSGRVTDALDGSPIEGVDLDLSTRRRERRRTSPTTTRTTSATTASPSPRDLRRRVPPPAVEPVPRPGAARPGDPRGPRARRRAPARPPPDGTRACTARTGPPSGDRHGRDRRLGRRAVHPV